MVAIAVLLLLQVPPVAVLLSVLVVPMQSSRAPVISSNTNDTTLMALVSTTVPQPLVRVYEISAVPNAVPVTTPEEETEALALAVLHVPPETDGVSDMVLLITTLDEPVIMAATGAALTVMLFIAVATPQPLVTVYDMSALPAAKPVMVPDVPTVAMAVLALLHTPPDTVAVSDVIADWHTDELPVMEPAKGKASTDCMRVA